MAINDTSLFCSGIYLDSVAPHPDGYFFYELNFDGELINEVSFADTTGKRHAWNPNLHWINDTILFNLKNSPSACGGCLAVLAIFIKWKKKTNTY
jgi:hypothetical protein